MVIKINPCWGGTIGGESWLFTEHLGARRVFENRDEALPNFLSCFCVKSGRKHPPVTTVGDYRGRILMGQITQTHDKKECWYWSAPSHVEFLRKSPTGTFWSQFILFGPYQSGNLFFLTLLQKSCFRGNLLVCVFVCLSAGLRKNDWSNFVA